VKVLMLRRVAEWTELDSLLGFSDVGIEVKGT
jgi:hypothetical protein